MRHAGPVLLLALSTVLLTWPLVANMTDALPGYSRVVDDDLLVNVWSFWWTREAVVAGRGTLLHTWDLFHPVGVTLTLTAVAPAATVPLVPVMTAVPGLAGVYLAWNLNVLATFFLSGLGAYLLAYAVTRQPWAALVAGLAFAFNPYRYEHLRHINLSCTQWLPFVFWALWMRLETGRARYAVAFGAAVALVAASSTTYTAQLPLFGLAFVIGRWSRGDLARLVLPAALAALFATPLVWPAVRDMVSLPFETPVFEDPVNFAFPLEGFLLYNLHPYVSVTLLVLVAWALARAKQVGPWACVGLLGLALAPGPVVKTMSATTGIPLPYAIVRYFPGLGQNRFTERFLVFWFLGAAVLAAQALAAWAPFARAPRRWGLVVGALLVLELRHAPIALDRPVVPAVYAKLSEAPKGWPVYEWPADYLTNRRYMFYQMVHQRPLCQGILSRRPLLSYDLEKDDAYSGLENMILIVHGEYASEPHQREKLEVLRRRYVFREFAKDGPREVFLLTRKR